MEEKITQIGNDETPEIVQPNETAPQENIEVNNLDKTRKIVTLILKGLAIVVGLIFLIAISTAIYKYFDKPPIEEEQPIVIIPPTQVVQDFYNWHMNYKGDPIETGAYKFNQHLSTLFVNEIDNRLYKGNLNYDPFVCAQDKPLGVAVISEETQDSNSTVKINEDFGTDTQVDVHLVLEGTNWMISAIDCPQIEEQIQKEKDKESTTVSLYFNKTDSTECGKTYKVERTIYMGVDPLTTAVQELFKGPNKAEEIQGYTSIFSSQTEGMLKELKIADKTAYVNLKDYRNTIPSIDSCNSKDFVNQLTETIKHYRDVDNIVIAVENSTDAFDSWVKN